MKRSAKKMEKYYNKKKKVKTSSYKIGDYVLLYNPSCGRGKTTKLNRPYKGPYLIRQQLSDVTYEIEKLLDTIRGRNVQIVHVNRLKPVKIRFEPENLETENDVNSDDNEEEDNELIHEENQVDKTQCESDDNNVIDNALKRNRRPPKHWKDYVAL